MSRGEWRAIVLGWAASAGMAAVFFSFGVGSFGAYLICVGLAWAVAMAAMPKRG